MRVTLHFRAVALAAAVLAIIALVFACVGLDAPGGCATDAARCLGEDATSDTAGTGDVATSDTAETTTVDADLDTAVAPDDGTSEAALDTAPVCTAGAFVCSGDELRQCKSDGSGYTSVVTCPAGTCSASSERCTFCVPDTLACAGTQPTKCNALGSAFVANGAACVAPQTCGGGGTTGVCGCTPTPTTTVCAGKECGMVDNGCGLVSCGSCTGPKTCGGGGTANKCGGCGGTLPGPPMINAGGFCIDTTEVTQAQYQAFLAAKGTDYSGQPSMCLSQPYFPSGPDCPTWSPSTTPNMAVACVNWCQAYAYCKWAGKRLCGKIGGGATPLADFDKTTVDQWYKACTINGSVYFSYGGSYSASACVTGATAPTVVKSKSTCTGPFAPFDALYDMSGNVAEWTDSCGTVSGETQCRLRGGSYSKTGYDTACNANWTLPYLFSGSDFGIRCCAD